MKYSVVIVAAGSGSRMNLGYNKVFYPITEHETVLDKTINCFHKHQDCAQIIVVTQEENFELCRSGKDYPIDLCIGGNTRSESVMNGLKLVKEEYVLVHDGARPFITNDLLDSLVTCLKVNDACLLAVQCKDTIKVVEDGYVTHTPNRSTLFQAQTPQAFKTDLLKRSYDKVQGSSLLTDDASCVELAGECRVKIVEGSYSNIKITTIEDIEKCKHL